MIDQAQIKNDILALFNDIEGKHLTQDAAKLVFANEMSALIANAIQRGVQGATYTSGLVAGSTAITGNINLTVTKQ